MAGLTSPFLMKCLAAFFTARLIGALLWVVATIRLASVTMPLLSVV